jgi:hypothetical protein
MPGSKVPELVECSCFGGLGFGMRRAALCSHRERAHVDGQSIEKAAKRQVPGPSSGRALACQYILENKAFSGVLRKLSTKINCLKIKELTALTWPRRPKPPEPPPCHYVLENKSLTCWRGENLSCLKYKIHKELADRRRRTDRKRGTPPFSNRTGNVIENKRRAKPLFAVLPLCSSK